MANQSMPRSTRPSLGDRARFFLRRKLVKHVRVSDGEHEYEFRCESGLDVVRARTLLIKERGTVQWIRDAVKPGDVFYDIGANIGIYTPLAAKRVGTAGRVYAFEPHVVNVHALMHNVKANGLGGIVQVMSCALNDCEGFFDFNYYSDVSGSSNSQLHEIRDGTEREFRPVLTEHKQATTVDALIAAGAIRPATHIKLDVDGAEIGVLQGAQATLASASLRSVLVEVNPRQSDAAIEMLRRHGLELQTKITTRQGLPMSVWYGLFTPTAARV